MVIGVSRAIPTGRDVLATAKRRVYAEAKEAHSHYRCPNRTSGRSMSALMSRAENSRISSVIDSD